MIDNPIHLRLKKLSLWQSQIFMLCLCERMYPNFAFFCQQTQKEEDARRYKNILDIIWESHIVKNAKINFENQLEKLENIIPTIDEESPYSIKPAIDACEALSELLHSYLSGEIIEHAVTVSQISLKTIAELEMAEQQKELSKQEIKELPSINVELDLQWEIYRIFCEEKKAKVMVFKELKEEIREDNISNIGVFLSN